MSSVENPTGLKGIEFVEFTGGEPEYMERVFRDFGFSRLKEHRTGNTTWYQQNDIRFFYTNQPGSFAARFGEEHGASICSMGLRVADAQAAYDVVISRGARPFLDDTLKTLDLPAIYGIGDSLLYFVTDDEQDGPAYYSQFEALDTPDLVPDLGFLRIDHLTNNVYKGTMEYWSNFYKDIFGFREIRHFDIKGQKTGLLSYALQSPCGTFCIPINEGTEDKSQIEEYLRDYNGPGIQHLAFLSNDLLASLDGLQGSSIETLDIQPDYYETVFDRVPNVTEDRDRIKNHMVLVDGDDDGYLLQIFTRNLFGPIFIEMIQRKNHHSFGEGNFQALFDSIELDQERRGTL